MKKIVFTILMMLAMSGISMAQKEALNVDFNKIPYQQFPCKLESNQIGVPPIVFNTPQELSIYCSSKAQANIDVSQKCFVVGTVLTAVGTMAYTIGNGNENYGVAIVGLIGVLGGSVCEIVSVADLLGHWKWEYRRKQVDLYLTPGGAALKF